MIDNTGNNECRSGIEDTNLCSPFHRMGFSCSCSKCADARHVKADCKDKSKSLCFCEVCSQDLRDIRCTSGSFCTKSRADEIAACSVQGVQNTEQGLFGNRGCAEGEECLPFQSKEHSYRFNKNSDAVQDTCLRLAAKSIGQDEKHNGHDGNHAQGTEENIQCPLEGYI